MEHEAGCPHLDSVSASPTYPTAAMPTRPSVPRRLALFVALFAFALATGCGDAASSRGNAGGSTADRAAACDADDGGLSLPEGFCATVVAEVGAARHVAVADDGTIYVKRRSGEGDSALVALRDTTGDFKADAEAYFGDFGGTGVEVRDGYLYASSTTAVYRWPLPEGGDLAPTGEPEVVVDGFPDHRQHAAKSLAFDDAGNLYVNVGAPSNACQEPSRTAGAAGQDPCPLLEETGGVWRFASGETGQAFAASARYATGVRNAVALAWNDRDGALYVVQHGRDQLHGLWPDRYTEEQSAELPAEEMMRLTEGADGGWPYCYYDWQKEQKVLGPEYGGDGTEVGRCDQAVSPTAAFPGHWAPNDLLFYTGDLFPESYRGGAFVAFHGSWNRAPLPQAGYKVAFVPLRGGQPPLDYEVFADGFAGVDSLDSPGDAAFRPMALAQGPDGALYIGDSVEGRIWRVAYEGARAAGEE